MYASVNWVCIGSGNGLSPNRRQAITWTRADLLLIGRNTLQWNSNQNTERFIAKNAFGNVCEMAAILSRKRWVNEAMCTNLDRLSYLWYGSMFHEICTYCRALTHWGRDKMAVISQTISNAFSWMKMYELRLHFHWNWFLRVQLTIFQHWFR